MKNSLFVLAFLLLGFAGFSQPQPGGKDTSVVGGFYVTDSVNFNVKPGYIYKVLSYTLQYQPPQGTNPNADSVTLVKRKVYTDVKYYIGVDSTTKQGVKRVFHQVAGIEIGIGDLRKPK